MEECIDNDSSESGNLVLSLSTQIKMHKLLNRGNLVCLQTAHWLEVAVELATTMDPQLRLHNSLVLVPQGLPPV